MPRLSKRTVTLLACLLAALPAAACDDQYQERAMQLPDDLWQEVVAFFAAGAEEEEMQAYDAALAREGAELIDDLGCGTCHSIPGIKRADGLVGPPLDRMGRRIFIAGRLRNSPANMVTWLRNPQAIEPGTAMPDLGLSEQQARAITAYLHSLD